MQIVSIGLESICMKCLIPFSGKKNIIGLSSAELALRAVKVNKSNNMLKLKLVENLLLLFTIFN